MQTHTLSDPRAGCLSYVTVGAPTSVDGAVYVAVMAEALMHWDSGGLPAAWWCLVNGRVLGGVHRGRVLAGVGLASSRQRAFCLLRRHTLEQRANFSTSAAILGCHGLRKAVQQGHHCGDVLACPSEVREAPVVGEDPLVYGAGRGACTPTAFMTFNLTIDVRVLLDEPLSGLIDLQLAGS